MLEASHSFFFVSQGTLKTNLSTDTRPRKTQETDFEKQFTCKGEESQTEELVCQIQVLKGNKTKQLHV